MPVTPYLRQANFVTYEVANPTTAKRGTDLDAEFDAIRATTNNIQSRAAMIQRDDGLLANGSVHADALSAATFDAIAAEAAEAISDDVDAAADSADAAAAAAAAAGTSATNAAASALAAAADAANAAAFSTAASNWNVQASDHASEAQGFSWDSEDAAILAGQWANAANGVEIEPGKYSARHWAQQAASSVTGAMTYMGAWSATGGALPSAVSPGQYWRVSGAGTAGGTEYAVGDALIYNGATFDKIDNTEQVTSVAGRVGAIVLGPSDVIGLGGLATKSAADWTTDISGKPTEFTPATHGHPASEVTSGTFANARISAGNVTQHQASLAIAQSQVTNLTADLAAKAPIADPSFSGVAQFGGVQGIQILAFPGGGSYAGFWHKSLTPDTTNYAVIQQNTGAQTFLNALTQINLHINNVAQMQMLDGVVKRKDANSTALTNQPRVFVQSADPGAKAADGDLWAW
jgi:hypothetical protein